MPKFVPVLTAVLLLSPAAAARGQTIGEGAKVRIAATSLGEKPVLATVVENRTDTIVIRQLDRPVSISVPRSEISSLQMSAGTRRPILKYAFRGLVIGGVSAAAIGYLSHDESQEYGFCIIGCSAGDDAAIAGFVGGVLGLVGGGILGATRQTDQWTTIIDPKRVSIRPAVGGGLRLGYSAAF